MKFFTFRFAHVLTFALLMPFLSAKAAVYKCKTGSGAIVFSDTPCATDAIQVIKKNAPPASTSSNNQPADKTDSKSFTKDAPAIKTSDPTVLACLKHINTTKKFPDPDTTKLLSSSKKWVSVKDVGARQMVELQLTSKNENGMYVGSQRESCLMMGDGITVNTLPYELL